MRKAKIFLVSNSGWNIQNYRKFLIQSLEDKYEVIILCGGLNKNLFQKATLLYFPTLRGKFWMVKLCFAFILVIIYTLYFRPRAIISFTAAAGILLGIFKRCKLVRQHLATITGMGSFFTGNRLKRKLFFHILKITLSTSNVFVQNRTDYKIFHNLITSNISIVPGSGFYKPAIFYVKSRPNKIRFGFVGRIIESKRISLMLQAYRSLPDEYMQKSSIHLFGDFDDHSQEKSGFKEKLFCGNNIHFEGWQNDKSKIYNTIDVNILLSKREGLPRSLIEGFAYGVPAIVSNVPGCKDIVDHNINGHIVYVLSVEEVAKVMMLFIDITETNYSRLSRNAIMKFEKNYTDKNVNFHYHSYLSKII